jgi:hypothetical protein
MTEKEEARQRAKNYMRLKDGASLQPHVNSSVFMITEFYFEEHDIICYAENFPIDLKLGDEIYAEDFKYLFKKDYAYYPESGKLSNEFVEELDISNCKITCLRYGLWNGKIIKILTLLNKN